MADLYNPGKDIIDAYLKGVAIKQEREKYQTEREIERQKLELAHKVALDNWKKFESNLGETKRRNDAYIAKTMADSNKSVVDARATVAKGVGDGSLVLDETGQPQIGPAGNVSSVAATQAGMIEEAKNPALNARERDKQSVLLNNDLLKIAQQFKNQYDLQDTRLKQTASENEKNRRNAMAIAQARLAEARAKREDEKVALDLHTDAYARGIESGDVTREQISLLPTKEKSQILGHVTENNIRLLDNKTQERFNSVRSLVNYANKSDWAQKRMAGRSAQENFRDKELQTVLSELDSQGKIFATEIQGDKSILSERELPRLRQGTVQSNPVGWRLLDRFTDSDKVNDEANLRRVNEFKDIVKKNLKAIIGNAPESQWKSLGEKYGFDYNPYEEERRRLKKNSSKDSNNSNASPTNGSKLNFGPNVKDVN